MLLSKFRVHLFGSRPFVIYTDHASLRTATNSPHLSQRMVRWLSFFAEYNFRVEYKPGKLNVLADALSRRPDYELAHVSRVTTDLVDPVDPPRIVVPNDEDLKYDIRLEAHGAPMSGHLDREKTYQAVSQTFWWPRMYKWVAPNVKTCETCQRVQPSGHASAPLQSLPPPADCWKSMSLDLVFGLPADDKGNTGISVFACRSSKMVHLAPVRDKATGKQAAQLFLDSVFRNHGLPETIVSDRDPRFTSAFWDTLFQLLGTKLTMSSADHPQTDGQTERVNRVLEDICAEALNAVDASTGVTPFYLNGLRHPQVPLTLRGGTDASIVCGGEARKAFFSQALDIDPESLKSQLPLLIDDTLTLISRLRYAMASAQDKQKEYPERKGNGRDELVLLDTKNLPLKVVSSVESNKLKHRFIGPFAVLVRHNAAYTIDLPKSMATHPTFYVGRLKRYHDPLDPPSQTEEDQGENSPPRNEAESSGQPELLVSKPVTATQADTHASHTKGMTVQSGKNSGKTHTRKPSGTSTPAAHKRASDHAPHGLERLSLDGVPSGQKPELGGQHAHGALGSHDQERPNLGGGPQGLPPACQSERQPDHQVQV
ncbi:Pol protein [Phytophthora palmivora]|uniref:Pol protein n=1 Tax=Phytophthora palmivora TaxID=4796 RepID=A0A2P4X7M1_9STRA|nr:Pol protein [Phytophthora palmivora]